jgi:hypothetical protein
MNFRKTSSEKRKIIKNGRSKLKLECKLCERQQRSLGGVGSEASGKGEFRAFFRQREDSTEGNAARASLDNFMKSLVRVVFVSSSVGRLFIEDSSGVWSL